jgi:undecaprenyl-diphosphatase
VTSPTADVPGPARPGNSERATALLDRRLHRAACRVIAVDAVIVAVLAAIAWHDTAGATDTVDRRIAAATYARPGTAIRSLFSAITVGGKPAGALGLAVVAAAWIWLRRRDALLAAFLPGAVAAAAVTESTLKQLVGRARPATALLAHEAGRSFPSGHATAAAALATGLALVVAAERVRHRRAAIATVVAYSVAISASRLVLGVHFLTDVIAGTAVGMAVTVALALPLTRRRDANRGTADRHRQHVGRQSGRRFTPR